MSRYKIIHLDDMPRFGVWDRRKQHLIARFHYRDNACQAVSLLPQWPWDGLIIMWKEWSSATHGDPQGP